MSLAVISGFVLVFLFMVPSIFNYLRSPIRVRARKAASYSSGIDNNIMVTVRRRTRKSTHFRSVSVRKGDLTKEDVSRENWFSFLCVEFGFEVDAIIISSSSNVLREAILKAAGATIKNDYDDAKKSNSANCIIITPSGELSCQNILFLPWKSNTDLSILRQSIQDFVRRGVQCAIKHHFRSIAFPAVGMMKRMSDSWDFCLS